MPENIYGSAYPVVLDVDLKPRPRGIYIGGGGSVIAVLGDGTTVTFTGALIGTVLPISPVRILTGSGASLMLALV